MKEKPTLNKKGERKMKSVEEQVKNVIHKILEDEKSYKTSLNWAVNYCRHALSLSGEELRVQCLYILNNIQHWRHPSAKDVRATLKAFTKR